MIETILQSTTYRFHIEHEGEEAGYVYLHLLKNDTHEEPYGYFADLIVHEEYRNNGFGNMLVMHVIEKAKSLGCYKLVATSRNARPEIHAWYERAGFEKNGVAFRMNF